MAYFNGNYFDFGKLDKDADILSPIRNGEVRRGARWQDGKTARWRVVSCRFASLPFSRFAPLPPCHSHSQFCFYLPKSSYIRLQILQRIAADEIHSVSSQRGNLPPKDGRGVCGVYSSRQC
jgi:hypothetical protein